MANYSNNPFDFQDSISYKDAVELKRITQWRKSQMRKHLETLQDISRDFSNMLALFLYDRYEDHVMFIESFGVVSTMNKDKYYDEGWDAWWQAVEQEREMETPESPYAVGSFPDVEWLLGWNTHLQEQMSDQQTMQIEAQVS